MVKSNKFLIATNIFVVLSMLIISSSASTALDSQNIAYSISEKDNYNSGYYNVRQMGNRVFEWTSRITNHGPGDMHVVTVAFHDDKFGAEPTTAAPAGGFYTSGKTDYNEGETGTLVSTFDTSRYNCGRVQLDLGFIDERYDEYHDTNFFAFMVDYGVDCGSGSGGSSGGSGGSNGGSSSDVPVIDSVSPSTVDNCNTVLDIYGRSLTNVIQFFDSSGNRYTNVGQVDSSKTHTSIRMPSEVPAGNTRVRVYAAADRISNEKIITVQSCGQASNKVPIGWLDAITSEGIIVGWALDKDRSSDSIDVHIYFDGPAGSGTFISQVNANILRTDVNSAEGVSGNHGYNFRIPDRWRDGNTHTVWVHAIDRDDPTGRSNVLLLGVPKSFRFAAQPQNNPPSISSCNPRRDSVTVGSTVTIDYNIRDPENDPFTVRIDWGDGEVTTSSNPSSASHTYNRAGTFRVFITAKDSRNEESSQALCGPIVVSTQNNPPSFASCNVPPNGAVNSPININYGITDSENDPIGVTVNWGDGRITNEAQSSASHTYASANTYTISVTATDSRNPPVRRDCGSTAISTPSGNTAPSISPCGLPSSAVVGVAAVINYAINDAEGDSFSVTIDWGDGTPIQPVGPSSASHVYSAAGTYNIKIIAVDSKGLRTERNCNPLAVASAPANNPPAIGPCPGVVTVNLGQLATIPYSIVDPEGDDFTVSIDWGDTKTTSEGKTTASHNYEAPGTYTVRITARDTKNPPASSTKTCANVITVNPAPTGGNQPPSISSCTLASPTITAGGTATVNYVITEPNGDSFTTLINWGDTTSSSGTPTTASHAYSAAGTYNLFVTATDSRTPPLSSTASCGVLTVNSGGSTPTTPSATGSKLKITDVEAKVDSRTSHPRDGQTISRSAGPLSDVSLKIKTRNLFPTSGGLTIRDVVVKTTIESIDDGDDLEDESNEFDLRPQSEKSVSLRKFQVPLNVDDGDYTIRIEAEGVDENGTTQRDEINVVLEVEKDKHDLRFTKLTLNKAKISCSESFSLNFEIINLGEEDEEKSYVEVRSDELGLEAFQRNIAVESGTEGNRYSKTIPLKVTADVENGVYPLAVNVYSDDGKLQDSATIQLTLQNCAATRQINQTIATGAVATNISLYGTKTIEKTIQIPLVEILFRGTNQGLFWLLLSTLILSIFFVLVAIILMARNDE